MRKEIDEKICDIEHCLKSVAARQHEITDDVMVVLNKIHSLVTIIYDSKEEDVS